ncbi:hypothetical protein [Paraclostridium bifermentans]|uniref:hypothetical protein n=1 Tax=Paraclostridium bifermentans TaxID=1490 RepID=UPI0018A9CF5C|nr:hypothetical protein [Paraclostridium bifermentans]
MGRFFAFFLILGGFGFILSSILFKYILSKKYFSKYSDPHKYINLSFFLIFISGISYIFIGICSLYINSTLFLGAISLIPLVILTLSSKINKAFGIKCNKS